MSWRFRKSFKLLPGLKLNLTRHGLSATLGAAPFSLNVGPRGVYGNVSIPGTGVWDRERLDSPRPHAGSAPRGFDRGTVPHPLLAIPETGFTEIRSASTEMLKSQSMADLQKLLEEAYDERSTLTSEVGAAKRECEVATRRYESWEKGFLFKRLFLKSFAGRKEVFDTARDKREELQEQLRLTVLATQIDIDREQAEPYYKMRDAFAALSECQKTWDTLERRAIDRVAERSAANEAIKRETVAFALHSCDLIQWEQHVPHLPNRTGGDLYIYPGFVIYRAAKKAFAIIDSREVHLTYRPVRFIEDGQIPSDAQVVGQAWAKSNKDGSPDRRFRDNCQIPIALYGSVTFTSPSGLLEEFQTSNAELAKRFTKAWETFQASFARASPRQDTVTSSARVPNPVATTHSGEIPTDVAAAFELESNRAQRLALEHGEFWEFLLVEELLKSKFPQIEKHFEKFDETLRLMPKKTFRGLEFVNWVGDKVGELAPLTETTAKYINEDIPVAWGEPGESGDAIRILMTINGIIECCKAFLTWELDVFSAEPPVKLKRLRDTLSGTARSMVDNVRPLLGELSRLIEGLRAGSKELSIRIEFATPPQIAKCVAELAKVKKHPEWLVP